MRLKNFKSWADTGELRLAPVTGFFGANSSGKSSLLHAFVLMKQTAQSSDAASALNLGDKNRIVDFGNLSQVTHGNIFEQLGMEFRWETEPWLAALTRRAAKKTETSSDAIDRYHRIAFDKDLEFQFQMVGLGSDIESLSYKTGANILEYKKTSDSLVAENGSFELRFATVSEQPLNALPDDSIPDLDPPTKCYKFSNSAHHATHGSSILATLEREFEQQFVQKLHYLGPLRTRGERVYNWRQSAPFDVDVDGSNTVQALLAARDHGKPNARPSRMEGSSGEPISVEEHVAQWLKELGLASVFETRKLQGADDFYEVLLRTESKSKPISLVDVGFGVSQVLPVLVLLAYVPEGVTVLLEQPEMHLHPASQSALADILLEVATERKLQVIVESHSEHLLTRLQRRVAEGVVDDDDVALYFCEHDGHKSEITPLKLNEDGEIGNWPKNFFGDAMGEAVAMVEARAHRHK
ncbi:MAG: DUF3696 domain-containing protein [Acidimicrobiaceae bacterium]|nr:DUF3696 domain-containing protein [Acidimicrobiaceae bacterium]